MGKAGRPELFNRTQKELIAGWLDQNDKLSPEAIIDRLTNYLAKQNKVSKVFVRKHLLAPEAVKKFVYEYKRKTENPSLDDMTYWSSALLNGHHLNAEALPIILFAQFILGQVVSKPLTIREVNWLNRLCGFEKTLPTPPQLDEITGKTARTFILLTWSQLYAQREKFYEKIRISPDYSDLDKNIVLNDINGALDGIGKKWVHETASINAGSGDHEARRQRFMDAFAGIHRIDIELTMMFESNQLGFSLGIPDMTRQQLRSYHKRMVESFSSAERIEILNRIPGEIHYETGLSIADEFNKLQLKDKMSTIVEIRKRVNEEVQNERTNS